MKAVSGVLSVLILLAGCSSPGIRKDSQDAKWVEVEGWAPIDQADLSGTRQRALAEAQKKAVEKVVGVQVAASTRVEAAITVRQKITADIKGYIRRYDVLAEWMDAGFHKMRIKALVSRRRSVEGGQEDVPSEPPPGNPKVSVVIAGKGAALEGGANASAAVRNRLTARGFAVVDSGVSSPKPDFFLRGEVQTHPITDPRLGTFRSCRARIQLQVVEAATGLVIVEKSQETPALGIDDESASAQAIENAGHLIGTTVADELAALLWRR